MSKMKRAKSLVGKAIRFTTGHETQRFYVESTMIGKVTDLYSHSSKRCSTETLLLVCTPMFEEAFGKNGKGCVRLPYTDKHELALFTQDEVDYYRTGAVNVGKLFAVLRWIVHFLRQVDWRLCVQECGDVVFSKEALEHAASFNSKERKQIVNIEGTDDAHNISSILTRAAILHLQSQQDDLF